MNELTVEMTHKKSTKGTEVFEAKATGAPPAVSTLYIAKWALPTVPKEIIVIIKG